MRKRALSKRQEESSKNGSEPEQDQSLKEIKSSLK
jgi:hypothetical protein